MGSVLPVPGPSQAPDASRRRGRLTEQQEAAAAAVKEDDKKKPGKSTPKKEQSLIDGFANQLFQDDYHPETGLICFTESLGQLKPGVADANMDRAPVVTLRALRDNGPFLGEWSPLPVG